MYGFVSPERTNSFPARGHGDAAGVTLYTDHTPTYGANGEERVMSAPEEHPGTGFRLSLRSGPLVPLAAVMVGVVALTAAVTMGGEDSSSNATREPESMTATTVDVPADLPARNSCLLKVGVTNQPLSVAGARTLTQVAAVGWQVKAPEEMVARVLDIATAKAGTAISVTDALDMFTREDTAAPSAGALAQVRALTEPGALTCIFDPPAAPSESKGKSGLTPRASAMRQGVIDAFGKLSMSGFGGRSKTSNAAEAAGRALDVSVPTTISSHTSEAGAGWVLAHWLTARGADYKLDTVAYDDHVWAPTTGWQATAPGQPTATPARPGRVYVAVTPGSAASKATKGGKSSKSGKKSTKKRSS
jgi:hypothetical protein